jgi:hypothetical protein
MRHNVQRFSGSLEGHGGSAFYYLIAVPLLLLPWSGLFFNALARVRSDMHDPLRRFLWIWFGFVLAFFSLSGTKLPHYVLYGCTPLVHPDRAACGRGAPGVAPPDRPGPVCCCSSRCCRTSSMRWPTAAWATASTAPSWHVPWKWPMAPTSPPRSAA